MLTKLFKGKNKNGNTSFISNLGSDVDVDKLYSPRSDTTSGTNKKTPQQTKKSIPNEPPKTANRQDIPTEQTKPTVRPPVNKDNSSSESSNHIEVKATIHKPEVKDDPKVQKKTDTATKNPTKMNTADLSQSQAYKVWKYYVILYFDNPLMTAVLLCGYLIH